MTRKHDMPAHPPTPFHAFREVVYRHGVPRLAGEMMINESTLYHKADADGNSRHQPTLRDVIQVTRITGDCTILDSLDHLFNRAGFYLGDMAHLSDAALLELVTKLGKETGEFYSAMHGALRDRRFSSVRYQAVRNEAFDVVSALMTLLARMEGLVDD